MKRKPGIYVQLRDRRTKMSIGSVTLRYAKAKDVLRLLEAFDLSAGTTGTSGAATIGLGKLSTRGTQ